MKSIGIDIGTTTVSILVVSYPDIEIENKFVFNNGSFLPSSHPWERIQDVPSILSGVYAVLEEILDSSRDIVSIGLTGQMHGIVYLDERGAAVSPLYTWQDGRGNLQDFRDGRSVCRILSGEYGIRAASGYGAVTHIYNTEKGLVPPQARSFCTVSDCLGMALTGRTTPLLHISQAASLGLYDCRAREFRRDILAGCGADPTFLPQITPDLIPLGTFRGIPVSVSVGDNQASFLGSVRSGADSVLVNIGTGAQISLLSDRYLEGNGIEARPFDKDSYLLVGASLCGGSAYAALEKFFREYAAAAGAADIPQYDVMRRLLERQEDSAESWKVRTAFLGTRENPDETGSVSGIRLDNFRPASLIRGVLEGMAQELYDFYLVMQRDAGLSRSRLTASGNGVRRNPALQEILERRFGMPLHVEQNEEEAAFGAAVASLAAAGMLSLGEWMER